MKKIFYFALFCIVSIISGCFPVYIPYHSTAGLPYYSTSTKTKFLLNNGAESNSLTRAYAVISAVDNDTLSYIVIGPFPGFQGDRLSEVRLNNSIPLLPNQAIQLLKDVDYSIQHWNDKYSNEEGIHSEFLLAPENRIIQSSENVVNWIPTLKYNFQNNDKGPVGSLVIGEGAIVNIVNFNTIESVKDFSSLLNQALSNKTAHK